MASVPVTGDDPCRGKALVAGQLKSNFFRGFPKQGMKSVIDRQKKIERYGERNDNRHRKKRMKERQAYKER